MGIHTIARWESTLVGTKASRHGAAAIITSVASRQSHRAQQILTTARMDSQTGRRAGLWPRRHGAVRTRARAARRQLEDAPEVRLREWSLCDFGVGPGAIFRRHWHVASTRKHACQGGHDMVLQHRPMRHLPMLIACFAYRNGRT